LEEEVGVLEDERGAPRFPEVPARDDRLHIPRAITPIGIRTSRRSWTRGRGIQPRR
jgi:hypothetical protein